MENIIDFAKIAAMGFPGILIMIAILIASIYVLCKGADWLVEGAAQLAYRLGIPKIIVGATVVSLGTTSPEAAVSVMSAIQGEPGMALGNAIGSIICNTGLIFGLSCLIARLPVDRFILNRHGWLKFGSGILLVVLVGASYIFTGGNPVINRWMGIFLLALLGGYLFISVRWARSHPSLTESDGANAPGTPGSPWRSLAMIVAGLALVIVSAKVLILDVTQACAMMHIPQSIISATVVAFGTSLPELVTALTSIKKNHPELLVGNIIGANILNVLFVVGASAAATNLVVPPEVIYLHIPTMILILLLFRIFSTTSKKTFSPRCGIPLLIVYIAFIIIAVATGIALE